MKKFILSIFLVALGFTYVSAQEMTLRLQMPDTPPNVGEEFLVGVWFDVLEYPGYPTQAEPTLKSGQMGVTYDPAVLTPVKTGGPPPLQKYAWNLNGMFTDYAAVPAEALPTPGDLRFVSFTTLAPGMDPSFYGDEPFHMWDLKFLYNGGDIEISWQDADKTTPVAPNISGGTKEKIVTFWTAWDNVEYAMTYMNIPAAATAITWNGSVSTDWFDGANWDGGMVPTATDDVVIPTGMPNDPVIGLNAGAPEVALAMNITNDASITIDPEGFFTVTGTTFTNNGGLYMLSDVDNSASFIFFGDVAGDVQYWRFLSTGTPDPTSGWHYMSSPIAGFGSHNMYDYFINTWDEATGLWVQHAGDPQIPCSPAPEIFNDGLDGWSVNWDEDYLCEATLPGTGDVVEFVGAPNWGDQVGAVTASGVGTYPNFNLVGNPYPSYWDYDGFFFGPNFAAANIFDAIYYWDQDQAQYATYVNGISTNGGSNFVPPVQAFFFEALPGGGGPLTFTDAERAHVVGLPYWKNDTELVKLRATANGYTDETVIHFNENSTINRDNNDARKLISTASNVPTLYTKADGLAISINGMPATESVGMYFSCETAGTYTIEAVETGTFAYVVLEDLVSGEQTDLLAGAYTFDYTEAGDLRNFIVHFTPLGIGQLSAGNVNIWSLDNNIMVNVPSNVTGEIAVYNMMGQQVVRTDIAGTETQIKVSDVNTNYVVKVISESNTVTGKVYVK